MVESDQGVHQLRDAVAQLWRMRQPCKRQPADLEGLRTRKRIGPQLGDALRSLDGDLLDLHAARRREDDHQPAAIAVQRDPKVELRFDGETGLAPDAPHRVAADVHRQDPRSLAPGLLWGVDDGDATRLASPADGHLRLDSDAAELASRCCGLLRGSRQPTRRHRDAG